MKTALALIFVALATPALAESDGDSANTIRMSIYQTAAMSPQPGVVVPMPGVAQAGLTAPRATLYRRR